MANALHKVRAAFRKGIVHYALGCVCYNQMGMSPAAADAFVRALPATAPDVAADVDSAENRTDQIDTPPDRTRRTQPN